jgi:hypothetical protein
VTVADLRPRTPSPRCPTTPHGLPVRLLVDAPPRRRWPQVVAVIAVLAFGAVPAWNGVQGRVRRARAVPWRAEDPYGHPVTAGPVGLHPDVDDETHVGLWASTFAGGGVLAHIAPALQLDSDEPMTPERGRHLRTLAAFLGRAEAREPLRPVADPAASLPGLRVLELRGDATVALWLHAPRTGYGAPVLNAEVWLEGLPPGRWRVTWVDDVTGADLAGEERLVPAGGASLTLSVPPFTRHVAALVERIG